MAALGPFQSQDHVCCRSIPEKATGSREMDALAFSAQPDFWSVMHQNMHRDEIAEMWQLMVGYVVSWRPDRDDPSNQAVMAWINRWHNSSLMDTRRIAPGDRISAIKRALGNPWMHNGRILNYTTGHDFTNKLPIMFLERPHMEDLYFDLHSMCFVGVGPVVESHGHFPAAAVTRWKYHGLPGWITNSGSTAVLIALVSARDGLRILRGMRTLQRIYLYKLARKAIRPLAVASSQWCDVASIGTVTNVIYGFLRSSYKPRNKRAKRRANRRANR